MPSKVSRFDPLPSGANTASAALERAPGLKAEDVEEVFYGNVLSAK
jgi:acetyl-CoA acetyltransferase